MVRLMSLHKTPEVARSHWRGSVVPDVRTFSNVFAKFLETGTVDDRHRSGRPRTSCSEESLEKLRDKKEAHPTHSERTHAADLHIPLSSLNRGIKELGFGSYFIQRTQFHFDQDYAIRKECYEHLVHLCRIKPTLLKRIWFSDEKTFRTDRTVIRHNHRMLALQNPHYHVEVPSERIVTNCWIAMSSAGFIGPYYFSATVTGPVYTEMLKSYFVPQLKERSRFEWAYFQQDGAPPHTARATIQYLDETFGKRWIGLKSNHPWPQRSGDLSPLDFWLWSYLEEKVYPREPKTKTDLEQFIREELNEIPPRMFDHAVTSVLERANEVIARFGQSAEI
ncbi:putative transposable element tc3 transposase [Blattamonas nauphoetae]|uniref:Transposable element tc3 transposase n=1 Tax=Blattamonas nauphoetae TaxID=2049346 RepID=A0ABQ9Y8Y2_9EUKA|nr:putative transposable element tc3 transposase [Blattamonas nauphoetae]